MTAHRENNVALMAWDEVAARIAGGAAAILPIGAGAKEHGLHLPMDTDLVQAQWLAGVVVAEIDALIWPTLTYGHYPAFTRYAGSLSLSEQTLKAVIGELLAGLTGHGARKVLVIDTGISTLRPVADVIMNFKPANRVHHLRIHDGPRYRKAARELATQAYGSHADELETSRMLALAPHLVRMERAQASPGRQAAAGPLHPHDAKSPGYSPSGSYGDPTLATHEKGLELLRHMRTDVLEMAREAIASSV